MKLTPVEQRITQFVTPVIEDLGFELILVKIRNENGSQNVQIMAEDAKTGRLGVDDCAKISRAVAAVMDVEDPISGAYRLEISSPGIDRPLTRLKDFEAYIGYDIRLETSVPMENGQKRFRGFLKGLKKDGEYDMVLIDTDEGSFELPLLDLTKAKLVLTDELIAKTANES